MFGFWGIVYMIAFLPAVALCLASKRYLFVGVVMGLNWLAYILPVRANFTFGDDSLYFVAVTTATALALMLFKGDLWLSRVIVALIALLVVFGYAPLYIDLISLHTSMIIADIVGYAQIIAMYGAAGGYLVRNRFSNSNRIRRASDMGNFGFHKSRKNHNGNISGL